MDTASDPIETKINSIEGPRVTFGPSKPDQSLVLQDSYNSKLFSTTQIVVGGG